MSAKPFTVMVTGGAGYIGSHAVLALLDAGWDVVVVDNLVTGFKWAVPEGASFVEGDVANVSLIANVVAQHNVGAILHFAGSLLVEESTTNPLKYFTNNTAATAMLVDVAVRSGVRHLVFSSTAAVYGSPTVSPISETLAPNPINAYGSSKLMSEQILTDCARAHPFNFAALRYFNVAGADPHGRSGQSRLEATHLIHVAVEAATGKRPNVSVYGTDYPTRDGTGVRDYIHVSDLAAAHVSALEWLAANPDENKIMNVGYGRGASVMEVLEAVERSAEVTLNKVLAPRRSGDPVRLVADNALITATLDWRPQYANLDHIVTHALAWERRLAAQRLSLSNDEAERVAPAPALQADPAIVDAA